jgi:predicted nucleic acid-binding protein
VKYLLDVSSLIALLWVDHVHHLTVKNWATDKEIALCPITELGFIRISSHPNMGGDMATVRDVRDRWLKARNPEFIACDLQVLEGQPSPSSGKTTDWYLANLAQSKGMKWATLDLNATHPAAEIIKQSTVT